MHLLDDNEIRNNIVYEDIGKELISYDDHVYTNNIKILNAVVLWFTQKGSRKECMSYIYLFEIEFDFP